MKWVWVMAALWAVAAGLMGMNLVVQLWLGDLGEAFSYASFAVLAVVMAVDELVEARKGKKRPECPCGEAWCDQYREGCYRKGGSLVIGRKKVPPEAGSGLRQG